MAQLASAFPTAGGLYHWAAILGGRGWGWLTAWFNLAGLITVLAAINVGTYQFALARDFSHCWISSPTRWKPGTQLAAQIAGVLAITSAQALFNHLGIRLTAALTDFSGYWILFVAVAADRGDAGLRAVDRSGAAHHVYQLQRRGRRRHLAGQRNIGWLFLLGFLLPAYTVTGFDASAHTAEETVGASHHVPRGIVRSVLVSGLFGWVMLAAIVVAIPDMDEAARQGSESFHWIVGQVLPKQLWTVLALGIVIAQFFCGLATVTSASRMAYAFARDGGLPFSRHVRRVSPKYRHAGRGDLDRLAVVSRVRRPHADLFDDHRSLHDLSLYLVRHPDGPRSVWPMDARGRKWGRGTWAARCIERMAVMSIFGCGLILLVGIQPPNDQNLWTVLLALALTARGVDRLRACPFSRSSAGRIESCAALPSRAAAAGHSRDL